MSNERFDTCLSLGLTSPNAVYAEMLSQFLLKTRYLEN